MEILNTICWIVQIIAAFAVIVLVLLQQGKGADAGATFGASGSSASLFGASGSSNFLSRMTAIFATIFFIATFSLVLLANKGQNAEQGVMAGYKNINNVTDLQNTTKTTTLSNDSHKMNGSTSANHNNLTNIDKSANRTQNMNNKNEMPQN